ncbi:MAG TPA: CpsD/CapB family tyrosine-protein kinase [Devosiaceae bacterium]|nr:CpsD/CapB family tyrosine-protein kinase [Devosiaceae bacterium]
MDESPVTQRTPERPLERLNADHLQTDPQTSNLIAWATMAPLKLETRRLTRNRIVTAERADPAYLAFDMMRTKVLRSAHDGKWNTLAITSPTRGCGKSTVALNLAVSIARQPDLRVLLIDLDLRRPRLAQMLGHNPEFTMQQFLKGECRIEEFFVRIGDNLALGAGASSVAYPAELLQDSRTAWSLKRLRQLLRPDIVIYDLPPMLVSDDFVGFLPNVDLAMLVVAAEASTIAEIDVCERTLTEESKLLGVVLNKCRYKAEQYDNYQD